MNNIGIDYETFSDVNLPVNGLDNYKRSDEFRPLIASIAHEKGEETFDFILDPDAQAKFKWTITDILDRKDNQLVAHNAGFERMVFQWFGMNIDNRIVDSAVYARMLGAGEKLEVASRQLTNTPKLAAGSDLIQLFCIPNQHNKGVAPTPQMIVPKFQEHWLQFEKYCEIDARGSKEIADLAEFLYRQFEAEDVLERENMLELITYQMNQVGWSIDRKLIQKMGVRAWANTLIEQKKFFLDSGTQLNFNSPVQLKKYCADRGVKVKSLDKYQLPVVLAKVEKDIATTDETKFPEGVQKLREVKAMLECKQELGGSSLSKLQRILDLAGPDDRLRDQYIHVGAGQTFRTSGRGVQMQNLKKLSGNIRDMETVYDYDVEWTNTDMAGQLRQVFKARHPDGEIIVGDFSAVESRGLAYLAGEQWKLDTYEQGLDVYKVLVTKYMGIEYEDVTAEQRPRGKYSELSCGYQASAKAVQEFMFRLGFVVSLDDAAQNVIDWRNANPNIVQFWWDLDSLLKEVVTTGKQNQMTNSKGLVIRISPFWVESLQKQHPGATSLMVQIIHDGYPLVNRVIHGCYFKGNSLCYYKPEEQYRGGQLWSPLNKTASQKAKKDVLLTIYGGKLAGILTQSLCRELFYDSMKALAHMLVNVPNAVMVGQFHDEIAVEWWPDENGASKEVVIGMMERAMTMCRLPGFPLTAEIKSAHRYIK